MLAHKHLKGAMSVFRSSKLTEFSHSVLVALVRPCVRQNMSFALEVFEAVKGMTVSRVMCNTHARVRSALER